QKKNSFELPFTKMESEDNSRPAEEQPINISQRHVKPFNLF
ncbi:24768_t:CDS:1, partial [Cetraspora pellucida]